MKKQFYLNAGIIVLLWLACGTLYAQKYNLKTEVLVYIMPDSLELPVQEKGKFSLQRANVKSPALASALTKAKVTGIAKAFPAWIDKDSIVTRHDGKLVQAPPFHRIFTLTFNSETEADSAIVILKKSGSVLFVEKNVNETIDSDTFYMDGTQWYLNNNGQNGGTFGADINAEGAWAIYTGSPSCKIAIIDTGVELTHDDLSGKVTGDTHLGIDHGTKIAGIAAAKANNSTGGIRGVDWNAQIISKNIFDADTNSLGSAITAQKIIEAIDEGANVINRSGGTTQYNTTIAMAYAYAYKMDRVSVAAMGNSKVAEVRYPAALPNVIAVGATGNNDLISDFSTSGNHIDVVAPGGQTWGGIRNIFSTTIGNTYAYDAGTSFSCPQVAGLASLMKGYRPNLSNDDIRQIIRTSADDNIVPGFDPVYGYGRINAGRAMSYLTSPYTLIQNTASSGATISTSSQDVVQFISASGLATANYLVKRIEVQKTVSLPDNLYNIVGAWGRGTFSAGWSTASPNFGEGFCEVVPGSLTSTNMTLRTYVYQVWSIAGSYLGYYPATPANATFAYSVLGLEKPTISGPTQTCENSTITFSVVNPPVGFTWVCSGSLSLVSSSGNSATFYAGSTTGTASVSIKVGDVIVASKTITIGNASISISGPDFILSCGNGQYAPEAPCLLAGPYTWKLINSNDVLDIQTITTGRPIVSVVSQPGGVQGSLAAYSLVVAVGGLEHRKHINGDYGQKFVFNSSGPIIQPDFSIYPNPATDLLTIELTTGETVENTILLSRTANTTIAPYTIQLWNETRGLIRTVEGTERVQQVSLQGLPKGMYFVHLIVGEQTVQRKILFVN